MKKSALIISITITAFILVIVGGVFFALRTPQSAQAAPVVETLPTTDPTLPQEILDREATYQKIINDANTRLDQLQKENQTLKEELSAVQSSQAQTSASVEITPEQAAQVAANFMGDGRIYSVETGAIRGIPLYKITFSSGAIVYVSMDGQVVGSQAPLMASAGSSGSSPSSRGGGENESGEHEGGGD
jgi:hypothetical protein